MNAYNPYWLSEFRLRMNKLSANPTSNGIPVSIKLGVNGGCFCKNCYRGAHHIIDEFVERHRLELSNVEVVEHESGPEILTYIAAGVSLSTSLIQLITTIIQARSHSAKNQPDKTHAPLTFKIRRITSSDTFHEEILLEIPFTKTVTEDEISQLLESYVRNLKQPQATAKKNKPKKKK